MNNENFNIAPNDENEEFTVEFGEVINDGGTHDYDELDNKPQINGHTLEGNKTNEQLGIPVYSAGENITISDDYVISATGGGGGTSDYEDLSNLPKLNNVTLKGNKSLSDLGIQPAGDYALESEIPVVPTNVSAFTNDVGYLTQHQDISGKANKISVVQTSASTIEINPNTFYKFGEVASLNITLASITDNTIYNEYMFEFVSGTTATTLTLPSSIKWLETPTIDANKIYQCSIVDNIGILVGVTNV